MRPREVWRSLTTSGRITSEVRDLVMHLRNSVASDEFARALYLSKDMIAEMAAGGMTFGFHTHRHRVLSRLTRAEQTLELRGGVETIRAATGQASAPFCYPYGKTHTYNGDTLQILADEGYSMAFNTVHRVLVDGREARYELPRLDTRDLPVPAATRN